MEDVKSVEVKCTRLMTENGVTHSRTLKTLIKGNLNQNNMEAKLDGFRIYKIKERHEEHPHRDRKYTGPVYVMGLPGDIELFNEELEVLMIQATDPY